MTPIMNSRISYGFIFVFVGLLFVFSYSPASAIAPPPARAWFEINVDSVEQVTVEICSDADCTSVTKRYETALCGLFTCDRSGQPSAFLSQGFGCAERLCAFQNSGQELLYRLLVSADGKAYASDVLSLIQFSTENNSWVVVVEDERLALTPMPRQTASAYRLQPLGAFWGWGLGFWSRWIGGAIVEVLLFLALLNYLRLAEKLFLGQLLLYFFWINISLYIMLALFIGSWHPLIIGSSRFWGYTSLLFGSVFLGLAVLLYRNRMGWVGQLFIMGLAAALLAVPGFFIMVISGFSSIDLYFGGVPTWVTIALAFIVALLVEAWFLVLAERQILKTRLALGCMLVTNSATFGILWGINLFLYP